MLTVIAVGFIFAGTHCTANAECEFAYKQFLQLFEIKEFTCSTYNIIEKMNNNNETSIGIIMMFMAAIYI